MNLTVRLTHWINVAVFGALVVSGGAILIAHPRLYWGETGYFDTPALITLPFSTDVEHTGWGRSLHFLAAWVCVFNGMFYVLAGVRSGHVKTHLWPFRIDSTHGVHSTPGSAFTPSPASTQGGVSPGCADGYHRLQRVIYLAVVFGALPLMIATGLAMSPALMAVLPIVRIFGGHQSARTIHCLVGAGLVVFLFVHVTMVWRSDFTAGMRRMIIG